MAPPFRAAPSSSRRRGVIDFAALTRLLESLDFDGFAIVEQDLYPCAPDVPLPIATRTRRYLREIGLG